MVVIPLLTILAILFGIDNMILAAELERTIQAATLTNQPMLHGVGI